MISPEVQQHLNLIIQNHGRVALNDPGNVEKMLREAAGDSRDVNLVVMALQSGIPQEIAGGAIDGSALASNLENEKFIAADAAQAAVQAWASALNAPVTFATTPPAVAVEPIVAPAVETPAPVMPAPIAPAPIVPTPAVAAPPPMAPVAQSSVAQTPTPAPAPAPAPYAAPAPQPQYNPAQPQPQPYRPSGSSSPNMAVILVIVATCVIGIGGAGFMWWKNSNAAAATTNTSTPPVGTSTSGGQPGANANLDLDGLNAKLADWHQRFVAAGTQFQQQIQTDSAETDQNTQLDKFGADYLKMSETLEVMASELDALNPPPEAAAIIKDLATNARDLSSKMGEGATAAKSHNATAFIQNSKDIETFGQQRKTELEAAITAGGFDVDNFNATGGLKKKA